VSKGQEVEVRIGTWEQLRDAAYPIRYQVFVVEQKVDPALELDDMDPLAEHALVTLDIGEGRTRAVATGRIVLQEGEYLKGNVGRIGRLAVLKEYRGQGMGKQVLLKLMEVGRSKGVMQFELHAQLSAKSLYEGCGFEPRGEVFDEAGIDHVLMVYPPDGSAT